MVASVTVDLLSLGHRPVRCRPRPRCHTAGVHGRLCGPYAAAT